jgi:hypothetical protein
MVNELRKKIYNIKDKINSPEIFETMFRKSTFSFNKTAIITWLTLAMTLTLYLALLSIAFAM